MGIPSYFSQLVKDHMDILSKFEGVMEVDYGYVDSNSLIYENMGDYEGIYRSMLSLKEKMGVKNGIYFGFDGVAPRAKLDQQKSRRWKSSMSVSEVGFDNVCITPGTTFMSDLMSFLKTRFSNDEKVFISGSDDAGEGEHKIMSHIRNHIQPHHTICIYGLDADLIMLALQHLYITPHIHLLRESPHFYLQGLEPNQLYLLNIHKLSTYITNEYKLHSIDDYIFSCFLMGNDFLPHFPALNIRTGGIHKVLKEYKQPLILNKQIQWTNLKELITSLSQHEETYIKNEHKKRDRFEKNYPKPTTHEEHEQYKLLTPSLERTTEKNINPFNPQWQSRYYKSLFPNNHNLNHICNNYLQGLEWTFHYYNGNCIDWNWTYKYHYPPLLQDLQHHIQNKTYLPTNHSQPITPITQLCYVLPEKSLYLLPPHIYKQTQHLLHTKIQGELWAYCKYHWERHLIINDIDLESLTHTINNITSPKID